MFVFLEGGDEPRIIEAHSIPGGRDGSHHRERHDAERDPRGFLPGLLTCRLSDAYDGRP
jgi:hypothetical protein